MSIILQKLSGYSAMAAVFIANNSDAQILYADIEPDTMLEFNGDHYDLDVDLDGSIDFHFHKFSFEGFSDEYGGETYHKGVEVGGAEIAGSSWWTGVCESCSTTNYTPYALDASTLVNNAFDFVSGFQMATIFDDYPWGGGAGNWFPDTEDKYLGIRFEAGDGQLHFGWIRCSVVDDYVLIVKDYAYNLNPDEPIVTGEIIHKPVWIDISDAGENMNGDDLYFEFEKSSDEIHINEYRVIAAKETIAEDFSLADAAFLPPESYKSVLPDGSETHDGNLSGLSDSDGDIITNNISYRLFIYSITDTDYCAVNILSAASVPITLQTETTSATDILISDIAENINSSDIHLQFNKAVNEDVIQNYRVFILDVVTIFDGFSLDDAMSVSAGNYFEIEPTGSDIELNLPAGLNDINGNSVTWGTPYYLFVASIDNGLGTGNMLSDPSNELILNFPVNISDNLYSEPIIYTQNNILHVELPENINGACNIFIYDVNLIIYDQWGRKVFEGTINSQYSEFELNIPAGIYFATLRSDDNLFTKEIIIQK